MVRAIVGANWGDEGKGKITDMLASESDIVVRFQGGANAGHTIINDYGRFALHLLPSGVCTPGVVNVLGPGVALDIEFFLKELAAIEQQGLPAPKILISERAQVLMPYHVALDCYEEERLGKNSFGSTKSGIAPFYGDKFQKIGLQLCQLYYPDVLREKLAHALDIKNAMIVNLYHREPVDLEALIVKLTELAERIRPYVADTDAYMMQAVREGKKILLEGQLGALKDPDYGIYPMVTSSSTLAGQLGTLKDPDHGIYPMVTSSSPLAGYGPVGAGVPVWSIKEVIAVTKAYSSCVGAGPFTTELFGDEAEELRKRGGDKGEFGATTGRPRRVGPFDCVASRYGLSCQGADKIALTKLDVLSSMKEIPVITGYKLDGVEVPRFDPLSDLDRVQPVVTLLPGWNKDISGCKSWDALPKAAKQYVEFLEKQLGHEIQFVSTGAEREKFVLKGEWL